MVNKVIILGRLGKNPELKEINKDFKVCNFSIAVSEKYKNKDGEKVENTEWINIVAKNQQAELISKYLKKGDMLFLEGKLVTRSYEKNNEKRFVTEVNLISFSFVGSAQKTELKSGLPDSDIGGNIKKDLPF